MQKTIIKTKRQVKRKTRTQTGTVCLWTTIKWAEMLAPTAFPVVTRICVLTVYLAFVAVVDKKR